MSCEREVKATVESSECKNTVKFYFDVLQNRNKLNEDFRNVDCCDYYLIITASTTVKAKAITRAKNLCF